MRLLNEFQFGLAMLISSLWFIACMFLSFHIGLAFFIWLLG